MCETPPHEDSGRGDRVAAGSVAAHAGTRPHARPPARQSPWKPAASSASTCGPETASPARADRQNCPSSVLGQSPRLPPFQKQRLLIRFAQTVSLQPANATTCRSRTVPPAVPHLAQLPPKGLDTAAAASLLAMGQAPARPLAHPPPAARRRAE
ncbi:hypothetical protein GTA08_BOTSDO01942 [Botryosphaeria dothidea]|uniref:Uncharacterized protein n=1 Tax=Botryosphaeria dothidea TaxID=55169 RepID=A0A8H4IXB4_9PEZI|nr:hypothetical protein GTA08_BOTSDO01942 [Botryosphaeria dothidea]